MAVQSSFYNANGTTRTFPSTKHIASSMNVAVWLKRVIDNVWIIAPISSWTLANNSIIFTNAPEVSLYSQIEIRVADEADELADNPNDISLVASNIEDIKTVADNISLLANALNGEYVVAGLPTTANDGDLAVNVLDGGIYEWKTSAWVLVAQSGVNEVIAPLGVNIVSGLPSIGANGEVIFNTSDGYFYGYINGVWTQMISTPTINDTVGIEVLTAEPTVDNYEGRVIFNTTTNMLMKYTGGLWMQVVEPTTAATTVADGSLTTAAFAATIRPVEIFDILPTTGNAIGRLVYLTTDGLLYRYTATGFSSAVPAGTITGSITSTQIADDSITTPKIAVGAITANEIAANAITSDKITSNSITTGMIQAGAIGATQIATNAITAEKLNAGSVTAAKIAALSIDATKIIAGSISSDKLAANSVIAGKISAGAVSAYNIAAGTITATQIATGTITATQLAAYSITSAKLETNALAGHHAAFDASKGTVDVSAILGAGQTSVVSANGGLNTTVGLAGLGKYYGVVGEAKSAGGGSFSVLGWGKTINTVGVVGNSKSYNGVIGDSSTGIGVTGQSTSGTGVFGKGNYAIIADNAGTYGFWTAGACWFEGSAYPFTGSHITFTKENHEIGDIIVANYGEMFSISQSIPTTETSSVQKDKRVFGVCCKSSSSDVMEQARMSETFGMADPASVATTNINGHTIESYKNTNRIVKSEYKQKIDDLIADGYKIGFVNAIGEGGINVCSEGGNIEIGDYICSSNTKGKGMKQDDDLLHNYTVAKALESVDWSKESSTIKMIACTYHCG